MGVDLFAITGHRLSVNEIVHFQDTIETDKILNDIWWWKNSKQTEKWTNIADRERIESFWTHNENQVEIDDVFLYDYLSFPTFFGEITFHRHIIELDGFGCKLWTLEYFNELRQNILTFNNRLAEILGQSKVIYYGDGWAKSSWIEAMIFGKTFEQIERQIYSLGYGQIQNIDESIKEEHLWIQKTATNMGL